MRGTLRVLSLLVAAWLLAACGQPEPWRQESYVFGTRVELAIAAASEAKARAAADKVLRDFDYLHRTYHAWQPSELSALNEAIAAGRRHQVSAEFAAYIREAQAVAAAGDHLFDPGIGRLIALWGFHTDDIQARLPDGPALQALLAQKPSIADLKLEGQRVTSRNRAVALDFGGYLKGVALDRAAALLKADGIDHALINIGGNVMALGSRDGAGTPWRIGIQHPRPQLVGGAPLATLELRDGEAIGTSGDYHRYFEIGDRRFCHLLDPRTGFPATATQAVTVLIPPGKSVGMRSDALSKPIFIAGADWRAMVQKLGVEAVLKVGADGTASATPAMHGRLKTDIPDLRISLVP
jgi:thiamine biosynthesis lipoprotein